MGNLNIYHYFLYKTNYLYRAFLLLILFSIVCLFLDENRKEAVRKFRAFFKKGWKIGFLFYLSLILTATIFARGVETPYRNILEGFLFQNNSETNFQICMNILMFIPYTFLYLKAFKPETVWRSTFILSTITTIFIELSQLFFWLGECQLSDVFYNILGGMIGCCIWYIIDSKVLGKIWKGIGKKIGKIGI